MPEVQFFTAKQKRAINEGAVAKAIAAAMEADPTLKPIDSYTFRNDYLKGKIILGCRMPETLAETVVFFGYLILNEGERTLSTTWIHQDLRGCTLLQTAQNWLHTRTN